MSTDLLVLLVQGPDRGQLPWWQSMCQARDVAFYQPGLVRCVWLKCLTVHCVPFWIRTVFLAALGVFAQCVFVCDRWQASPQRYREANCILITKPSNAQVRQLPSTPRKHTVNGAVKCVFSLLLLLILMSHYRRQSVEGNLRTHNKANETIYFI